MVWRRHAHEFPLTRRVCISHGEPVSLPGDYPAPRAVLTGHDHEVVCVSVCAELGLVISGAKGGFSIPQLAVARRLEYSF